MSKYKKVVVVGAGGVGFYLTVGLCKLTDPHTITVFDNDDLQGGNGHARLPKAALTTRKVDLLKGYLFVVHGITPPNFVFGRFTGEGVDAETLVVDCTDSDQTPRKAFWDRAQELGARVIRVSYDGKFGMVTISGGIPIGDVESGGYAAIPSLALSFMAGGMGAEVVHQILKGLEGYVEFQFSLADFGAWKSNDPVVDTPVIPIRIIAARPAKRKRVVRKAA